MIKKLMIAVFTIGTLLYAASAYYFHSQEKELKSTFLENVKKNIKTDLKIDSFRDTLVNYKGDTTFIDIPNNFAAAGISNDLSSSDTASN